MHLFTICFLSSCIHAVEQWGNGNVVEEIGLGTLATISKTRETRPFSLETEYIYSVYSGSETWARL